jgi:hypothetical protein
MGENDWCDSLNMCLPTSQLRDNSYPKMHPKYDEIIEKLQSINNAKPDPNKDKNEKRELIENWIESHYEELEDSFLLNNDIEKMWKNIWDEQFDYPDFASDLEFDYDIDSDSLDDAIDERDNIYLEVQELKQERIHLQEPLDKEWHKVKEERKELRERKLREKRRSRRIENFEIKEVLRKIKQGEETEEE